MAAPEMAPPAAADGLASLERLKQVETDGDSNLRMLRGKIDLTLSQLRADSETQIQAARANAEAAAASLVERADRDADAEAARIVDGAKADLAERGKAGPPDLTGAWPSVLDVLFGEFR